MKLINFLKNNLNEHLGPSMHWVAQDLNGSIYGFKSKPNYTSMAEQWVESKYSEINETILIFKEADICEDQMEVLELTPEVRLELHKEMILKNKEDM